VYTITLPNAHIGVSLVVRGDFVSVVTFGIKTLIYVFNLFWHTSVVKNKGVSK